MKRKWLYSFVSMVCAIALTACAAATPASSSNVTPGTNNTADGTSNSASTSTVNTTNMTKLNLNTASGDEFQAIIPGLGGRMVREFNEYRPYISIQQFRQEIGKYVDDAQVAEYEKYVYVPIKFNDADAATLQQIPGLDATEAQALMDARPYASADDFLSRLSQYVSAEELAIAQTYLEQ